MMIDGWLDKDGSDESESGAESGGLADLQAGYDKAGGAASSGECESPPDSLR
jgi:hypothetical protein